MPVGVATAEVVEGASFASQTELREVLTAAGLAPGAEGPA